MIPVIDFSRIFVLLGKIVIFSGFVIYFYSHIDVFTTALFNIVNYVKILLGGIVQINLGCFMDGIGGTVFLNSLVNQFVLITTFTVSSLASILSYKFIVKFFSIFMTI